MAAQIRVSTSTGSLTRRIENPSGTMPTSATAATILVRTSSALTTPVLAPPIIGSRKIPTGRPAAPANSRACSTTSLLHG